MQLTISGCSDDNIEIEGDLGRDEFGAYDSVKQLLLSDGTTIRGEYCQDGCWRFVPTLSASCQIVSHTKPEPDADGYFAGEHSERLTLTGEWSWIQCWGEHGPTTREIIEWFENHEARDWAPTTLADWVAIYRLAVGHKTS